MDVSDLETYFQHFKNAIQNVKLTEINQTFCSKKVPLQLRFHQELITSQIMKQINGANYSLLLGAKARSGKTYCVGGLFIKYFKQYNKLNALIITPAPKETLSQFTDDLFHKFQEFTGINIVEIKKGSDFDKMHLSVNNIIIASKQLLDDYVMDKTVVQIKDLYLNLIV